MEDLNVSPLDEFNQALLSNVHPPDWINPEPAARYNLVVIGAGTAGLVTAAATAGLGGKVALVERHLMGGDCLNVGCVPSKALIRSARAYADVRDAHEFGVKAPKGAKVDFPKVMERMRRLRSRISPTDSARRFSELGVDVFIGQGSFSGPATVEVAGKTLRFSKAVIATGARAAALPIPGLAEAGYLTNETVFNLTELPRRLAVLGGGPIGCEMAQSFARFGSEVYQFEKMGQILTREDRDAAKIVEAAMLRDGVQYVFNSKVEKINVEGGEKVIDYTVEGKPHQLKCDAILLGVGRAPNVEGLGLEKVGVQYDARGGVSVNDYLQTSNPRIFAAGDICSKYKFTHTADFLARAVIRNALFPFLPFKAKASALTIPWCTYTDPEIAHVGMYEHEARERGIEVETLRVGMDDNDRAILEGETEGFLKLTLRKGRILGATLVARHAGEMISEISLAMVHKLKVGTLAKTIHPYPTQAEIFRKAGDTYNRTRLTPTMKKIFEKLMAWQR